MGVGHAVCFLSYMRIILSMKSLPLERRPMIRSRPLPFASAPALRPEVRMLLLLVPLLIVTLLVAVGVGAVGISIPQVLSILLAKAGMTPLVEFSPQQQGVLEAIRLPRVLLGALVGAGLAVSGAAMQGLFRNPLADPGLLGVSSGAALAAALTVVLGLEGLGFYALPVAAFLGSIVTTVLIYAIAGKSGRFDVSTMLLAGIAINALCGAGTGLCAYLATNEQLRTITFWQLGSLGGATWDSFWMAVPFVMVTLLVLPFLANALNALLLGEANARHLGIPVEVVKWAVVTLVALGVGAGVAVSGMIGFVGLVVPHLIRLWLGPNHRVLIGASALLGASLLVAADTISRVIVAPSELPIGIVTAFMGAPFFLFLLLGKRGVAR